MVVLSSEKTDFRFNKFQSISIKPAQVPLKHILESVNRCVNSYYFCLFMQRSLSFFKAKCQVNWNVFFSDNLILKNGENIVLKREKGGVWFDKKPVRQNTEKNTDFTKDSKKMNFNENSQKQTELIQNVYQLLDTVNLGYLVNRPRGNEPKGFPTLRFSNLKLPMR